jgi:hypothetical protein
MKKLEMNHPGGGGDVATAYYRQSKRAALPVAVTQAI